MKQLSSLRHFAALALAVPLGLAACGQVEPTNEDAAIEVRGEQQEQLFTLTDMNRDIAMRRAITAAGYPCDRVTGSGYASKYESMDLWVATCDDNREWAIFIGPDDTAQVRYCSDLEGLNLPSCAVTRMGTGIYADASVGEAA